MKKTPGPNEAATSDPPVHLPKLCGADIELGSFILGSTRTGETDVEAAQALLKEIDGVPNFGSQGPGSAAGWGVPPPAAGFYSVPLRDNVYDWDRKFLTNGGCAYIDQWHPELCLPEVRSAYDHVAAWHAQLRLAQRAQTAANAKLPRACLGWRSSLPLA